MKTANPLLAAALALLLASPAQAERNDRNKPIQLEAQRMTIDDARKVQVLDGNVQLVQGTLMILADKIVMTEDKYGFQKGVATGGKNGLARFRQKREGLDEYVEGEAERIEYNTRNEVAELFRRAWMKSGEDQVRGDYIWYDAISEKYMATAGDTRDAKGIPPRVRAVIQPRNKAAPEPSGRPEPPLELKGTQELQREPGSR